LEQPAHTSDDKTPRRRPRSARSDDVHPTAHANASRGAVCVAVSEESCSQRSPENLQSIRNTGGAC
jgi:hypothetical protein